MHLNYFNRFEKLEHVKPTIEILLFADKNNAVVKFTLPENNLTFLASQYKLIPPTEEQLLNELECINLKQN